MLSACQMALAMFSVIDSPVYYSASSLALDLSLGRSIDLSLFSSQRPDESRESFWSSVS